MVRGGGGGDKHALWSWCGPCGSSTQVVKMVFDGCKKGDVSPSLGWAVSGRFWRKYTRVGKVLVPFLVPQEQSLFQQQDSKSLFDNCISSMLPGTL